MAKWHLGYAGSLAALLGACGSTSMCFQATDGTLHGVRYHNAPSANAAGDDAAIASAAHDIPCDRASISVVWESAADEYVLEGCGQRVTYRTVYYREGGDAVHFVLAGRFPLH